jgi:hypothetical protein
MKVEATIILLWFGVISILLYPLVQLLVSSRLSGVFLFLSLLPVIFVVLWLAGLGFDGNLWLPALPFVCLAFVGYLLLLLGLAALLGSLRYRDAPESE